MARRHSTVVLVALAALCVVTRQAHAQATAPATEIGGHVVVLHLPGNVQGFDTTAAGGGIGATFFLSLSLGIDGEVDFLSDVNSVGFVIDSPAVLALAGVRWGWRGDRIGVFARVRPGLLYFTEDLDPRVMFVVPPPAPDNPHAALDVGAGFEVLLAPRAVVRIDAGQTIVRFRYRGLGQDPIRFTKGNTQVNLGVRFRF